MKNTNRTVRPIGHSSTCQQCGNSKTDHRFLCPTTKNDPFFASDWKIFNSNALT